MEKYLELFDMLYEIKDNISDKQFIFLNNTISEMYNEIKILRDIKKNELDIESIDSELSEYGQFNNAVMDSEESTNNWNESVEDIEVEGIEIKDKNNLTRELYLVIHNDLPYLLEINGDMSIEYVGPLENDENGNYQTEIGNWKLKQ